MGSCDSAAAAGRSCSEIWIPSGYTTRPSRSPAAIAAPGLVYRGTRVAGHEPVPPGA